MSILSPLDALRRRRPLVHCVSNIVTANDCANVLLAAGASPIMAQAVEEMAEITAGCDATVLNTGTPEGPHRWDLCRLCGQLAAADHQPVVLDPVGVGASAFRLAGVESLLEAFTPTLVRVNLGEAQALLHRKSRERGVDSADAEEKEHLACAAALARKFHTTVLLTGAADIVTDGVRAWRIRGGSDSMARITGAGCMLSALCGAFCAAEEGAAKAAVAAAAFWKACSHRAEVSAAALGPGHFHMALLDAAGTLTAEEAEGMSAAEPLEL